MRSIGLVAPLRPIWYQGAAVVRLALAVVLALFLGQALASPAFAALEVCRASCPDDGPDGDRSPVCLDCGCCSLATRILIPNPDRPAPPAPAARCTIADGGARLPAWDPPDVFHVPKPHLA